MKHCQGLFLERKTLLCVKKKAYILHKCLPGNTHINQAFCITASVKKISIACGVSTTQIMFILRVDYIRFFGFMGQPQKFKEVVSIFMKLLVGVI